MKKKLLTLILLLVTVFGVFAVSNLKNVEALNHTGAEVYFDNSLTKWKDSKIMLFIGHNSYTSVFEMTKVNGTNLYHCTVPKWDGATYCSVAGAGSLWGAGNWGPSNRTNATHYTNTNTNYEFKGGSAIITPKTSTNNTAITITYLGSGINDMTVTVKAHTSNGSSYSESNVGGYVNVGSYYLNSGSKNQTGSSATGGTSASEKYDNAVRTANTTLTATVKDGYKFVGWFDSATSTTAISNSLTCTVNPTGTITYYAKFAPSKTLNEMFTEYYGTGSYTKNTTIYVDAEKVNDDAGRYFHAQASDLVRKTVYTDGKLVMTTTEHPQEVGYKNVDGNMVRFHVEDGVEKNDFTVKNTSVEDYYVTLFDFYNGTGKSVEKEFDLTTGWTYEAGVYKNTSTDVLEAFRLFVAPMWINTDINYIIYELATVEIVGGELVMQLWVSSENSGLFADDAKPAANGYYLFAEAKISK